MVHRIHRHQHRTRHDGGQLHDFPVPTATSEPDGIAAGPDGAVWFTEFFASSIGRVTTRGRFSEFPTPTSGSSPIGIAAGPDGALWFTENGAGNIGRITISGSATEFPIPTPGSGPVGITAGPDGGMWFTEFAANKIGRIDAPVSGPTSREQCKHGGHAQFGFENQGQCVAFVESSG